MNEKIISCQHPEYAFLPKNFRVSTWEKLKTYYDQLLGWEITSPETLKQWLEYCSELESAVAEDMGWRYIKMTCFTEDKKHRDHYHYFAQKMQPHISSFSDRLNKKMMDTPYVETLAKEQGYDVMIRGIRKDIVLFREINIPLFTQIDTETQKYSRICGAMTVSHEDKEITLQQAAVLLMSTDRKVREESYKKIISRRLCDRDKLDELFSRLLILRHQIATNAGFDNFRDYMFQVYGRFDYTPNDCVHFHQAVETSVVPLLNEMASKRKENLGVDLLRPWDKHVDSEGREPLKAFSGGDDLVVKAIECFTRIDPYLGQCMNTMRTMQRLDLTSRQGKAPGGYNYPLPETGVPFIFMNATSTLRDVVTLMHEGGHAVHNFLTMDWNILAFKSPPMEAAELASMSMELISMDYWDVFFEDQELLRRAKHEHLEGIIDTLPWVAAIDAYQHWLYDHVEHTADERKTHWNLIVDRFMDHVTDWEGFQEARDYLWQKQLHLYEVPFYYIEYGIAQLGAIAIWRNYKKNPQEALQKYVAMLKLGYTQTLPELYATAGIRFDFSSSYINELVTFLRSEMTHL